MCVWERDGRMYTCMFLCVRGCAQVWMSMRKPEVNICSLPFLLSPLVGYVCFNFERISFFGGVAENSGCHLGRLNGQWDSRICPSLFLYTQHQCFKYVTQGPDFMSMMGTQAQVHMLAQQVLYTLSDIPSPAFISLILNLINSTITILPAFQAILIIYLILQDN